MNDYMAKAGGLFAYLAFVHFFVDFLFQTDKEAHKKSTNSISRGIHCLIYSSGLLAFMGRFDLTVKELLCIWMWLFVTHFIEDTYYPVYLWAKHMRMVPGLNTMEDFGTWVKNNPIGLILAISVDQIIHLACLWPVVWTILG
jgi:hypothetical protein